MRVDPNFITNMAGSLDQTQAKIEQLSDELSSGLRVTKLSDDSVAAGQNVLLLDQIERDDSFTQSASLVQGQLQVADSALGGVVTQLNQAISVATGANNGTMNASQLAAVSNQLAGIRDEVVSLANTSYQGRYIFGGAQTATAPFATSGAPAVTSYGGDDHVNYLETPNGASIQLNMPGDQIFSGPGASNVFAALNSLIADYANGVNTGGALTDAASLTSALNYVSAQRVTLDNSLTRLNAASDAVTSDETQVKAAQTNLMQADLPQVTTQLSLSETQQTALEDMIVELESASNSLFNKLGG
ncbi:MAG TPA: flagellar hook-associated protein FlgL [Terracidiphilus sp.]|nr:flagellar hook-associated protein FlgL [Terracidiphilus sp.]